MLGFNNFLIEMNVQDAMKVLGLSSGFSEVELTKAFRRASSANHPDKGGSTEKQQQINQARDLLKKNVGHQTVDDSRETFNQEWRDIAVMVRNDLEKNLNINAYTAYFKKVYGVDFVATVKDLSPSDDEIKKLATPRFRNTTRVPYYVNYKIEWATAGRDKVLELGISVYMANLFGSGGLASPGTTYQMGVSTFAYNNGRKLKITARDYDHTAKKSVFSKPETVFPSKKLIKKKPTKFKKADMLSALKAELKAVSSGDTWYIPTKDDKFLAINRMTWNRQAIWNVDGIWFQSGKFSKKRETGIHSSFDESEATLDIFRKVARGDSKAAIKLIDVEYKKRSK